MSKLVPGVGADDHSGGPADALVTLVGYGDYECPYCGDVYPVVKAVQRAMGDRLRFVFRNFPISEIHPHALGAAQFAEAAAEVGLFWLAHDLLYKNQRALGVESLLDYGDRIGLARASLKRAFQGRFDARIRSDFMSGVRSGVNGTPSLFINGARYDGPRDVDGLVRALSMAGRFPSCGVLAAQTL